VENHAYGSYDPWCCAGPRPNYIISQPSSVCVPTSVFPKCAHTPSLSVMKLGAIQATQSDLSERVAEMEVRCPLHSPAPPLHKGTAALSVCGYVWSDDCYLGIPSIELTPGHVWTEKSTGPKNDSGVVGCFVWGVCCECM
jgi:hypothetical protein